MRSSLTLNDPAIVLQADDTGESEPVECPAYVPIVKLNEMKENELSAIHKVREITYNSRGIASHNLEDEHRDERVEKSKRLLPRRDCSASSLVERSNGVSLSNKNSRSSTP